MRCEARPQATIIISHQHVDSSKHRPSVTLILLDFASGNQSYSCWLVNIDVVVLTQLLVG